MIPSKECKVASDVADYNTIHGIALKAVRLNNSTAWTPATDAAWFVDVDWQEVTEMQFADGSVWRLNQCHTPPTIVMRHTEIRA